jgi:hypothetical protein
MLVTFSTDAYANIMVFGDVAQQLLKMMGHSGSVPGAIVADDVGNALDHLKGAIASAPGEDHVSPDESKDDPQSTRVSLKKRALPLIELLDAADRKKCDVMWK